MALVLSGERPAAAARSRNLIQIVAAWFARARADRAQRLALKNLLELDSHRLRDLGIERSDLFEAMHATPQRPTRHLAARRAARLA